MLEHGGNLLAAARRYNIPAEEWLDLSTGINPRGWPVPTASAASWQRLPHDQDGLHELACTYYGAKQCMAVAGSQAAIHTLPRLRRQGRIGMLVPSYAEHAHAWQQQGHHLVPLHAADIDAHVAQLDVLLLVNPNNPTGERFDIEQLLNWQQALAQGGGWLIVDEAFMDSTPEHSLARYTDRAGLIVLRSVGKFFGLAGARCGFVLAEQALLQQLQELIGPWSVSGPTREVVQLALADSDWQQATRQALSIQSQRLTALLHRHGLTPHGVTSLFLFLWLRHARAWELYEAFARRGILLRHFSEPQSLRFGLPAFEHEWQRLEQALAEVMPAIQTAEQACL